MSHHCGSPTGFSTCRQQLPPLPLQSFRLPSPAELGSGLVATLASAACECETVASSPAIAPTTGLRWDYPLPRPVTSCHTLTARIASPDCGPTWPALLAYLQLAPPAVPLHAPARPHHRPHCCVHAHGDTYRSRRAHWPPGPPQLLAHPQPAPALTAGPGPDCSVQACIQPLPRHGT